MTNFTPLWSPFIFATTHFCSLNFPYSYTICVTIFFPFLVGYCIHQSRYLYASFYDTTTISIAFTDVTHWSQHFFLSLSFICRRFGKLHFFCSFAFLWLPLISNPSHLAIRNNILCINIDSHSCRIHSHYYCVTPPPLPINILSFLPFSLFFVENDYFLVFSFILAAAYYLATEYLFLLWEHIIASSLHFYHVAIDCTSPPPPLQPRRWFPLMFLNFFLNFDFFFPCLFHDPSRVNLFVFVPTYLTTLDDIIAIRNISLLMALLSSPTFQFFSSFLPIINYPYCASSR